MFVCHLVLDDQTGWPTMSNFAKLWSVSIRKSIFTTWIENPPEHDLASGGHSNGAFDSLRHRGWGQDRVGKRDTQGGALYLVNEKDSDNGNDKDKYSNKDNGKDKDNNPDQDRVGKHDSQSRFFFASWN